MALLLYYKSVNIYNKNLLILLLFSFLNRKNLKLTYFLLKK